MSKNSRREFLKDLGRAGVCASLPGVLGSLPEFANAFPFTGASWQGGLTGGMWLSGASANGQLGNGGTSPASSPVQLLGWHKAYSANTHVMVIAHDGSLWGWGQNNSVSRIGLNDTTTAMFTTPVLVSSANWVSVSTSLAHTMAVRDNGTLWGWGSNVNGELGRGDVVSPQTIPVQIGVATDWDRVIQSYGSVGGWTIAMKTNGTLWVSGYNSTAVLGQNDTVNKSTLVQIAGTWSKVAGGGNHMAAVKSDGTLWTWGTNSSGQLGTNDIATRSSPVQVGALTNWVDVSCGNAHTLARKSDGSLWAFGTNATGILAQPSGTAYSSPVLISGTWGKFACGSDHSLAFKTDGTLWAWGNGFQGQLGNGAAVSTNSSPVQISGYWSDVQCGKSLSIFVR